METHEPLATYFHELPWKSTFDVPAHVVPAPAAQSFWPASATPKHFSFSAAAALFTETSEPADKAEANALAMNAVDKAVFTCDMVISFRGQMEHRNRPVLQKLSQSCRSMGNQACASFVNVRFTEA
jgi:hypothetical protein